MSDDFELVAVSVKLVQGNFDHWAVSLHGPSYSKLFQVAGDYAEMEARALEEDATDISRLYKLTTIETIATLELVDAETVIGKVAAQNDEEKFRGPADETRHLVERFVSDANAADGQIEKVSDQQHILNGDDDDDEEVTERPRAFRSAEIIVDSDDED